MRKTLIKTLIMLLTGIALFYVFLPAINIHDAKFYFFVLFLLILFLLLSLPSDIANINVYGFKHFLKNSKASKTFKVILALIVVAIFYDLATKIIYSPIFMSKRYAQRIEVEVVDFDTIPPYNFNQTAIIDRNTSQKLGDKVMGEMTDLVSQFVVSYEYSQID